jgi:hypothetical protein
MTTGNTEPNDDKIYIPKELYGDWNSCPDDPFPNYDGIIKYAQEAGVWEILQMNIDNKDYPSVFSVPTPPLVSEIAVEISLQTHFNIVNLAMRKTCPPQATIVLANGKAAKQGDGMIIDGMEPDRSSFRYERSQDEDGALYACFCVCDHPNNMFNQNILPGEVKVAFKFRLELLTAKKKDASGILRPHGNQVKEAEKVFTQIYQYMNKLGTHYGYLITDQELICVRRCSPDQYGAIDITTSIPLSVECGHVNAKLALWYMHHRYLVHDPSQSKMPMTPQQSNWPDYVQKIGSKRKEREDEEFKHAKEAKKRR